MTIKSIYKTSRRPLAALAIAMLVGCQGKSREAALPPPVATVTVTQVADTPLTGAVPTDFARASDSDAVAVNITLLELEHMPAEALSPLGSQATFISASRGGSSVLPTTRLTLGTRFSLRRDPGEFGVKVPPALTGRITIFQTLHGALFPGTHLRVRITDDTPVPDLLRGRLAKRWSELAVYRPVVSLTAA
ncbi:MAG: hypothetical protein WCI73_10210, partial [Phycisphaerae bacterium]